MYSVVSISVLLGLFLLLFDYGFKVEVYTTTVVRRFLYGFSCAILGSGLFALITIVGLQLPDQAPSNGFPETTTSSLPSLSPTNFVFPTDPPAKAGNEDPASKIKRQYDTVTSREMFTIVLTPTFVFEKECSPIITNIIQIFKN